ncbi:Por secretion system C-terminal sorting domain-containing protein [Flexibacter flexilis DSM 6793]|uniref:Por secretion system C-terminal sorting domain-containing protein n=1 Tax=Flexibacter flexilis DSM 6793 TaxID=927664 RepID=A0A1I1KHH4_9BACT|nr:type IX secretion system sortase PorU [Flexibacter flexilis]SFC60434.1 Por secretion system C-terminal sorting domain-containing protein [Flexibacter flexilis DSM 6793]
MLNLLTMISFSRQKMYFCLLALGLFFGQVNAQTVYELRWESARAVPRVETATLAPALTFENSVNLPENQYLPQKSITLNGKIQAATLQKAVYAPLSTAEKASSDTAFITSEPAISYAVGIERGQHKTDVRIVPLRRNTTTHKLEKLVRFELKTTVIPTKKASYKTAKTLAQSNSVLSSGTWHKLGITQKGLYKIDRSMLANMGFNVGSLDPRKIKIYGNGGGLLPQSNAAARANDLTENAIVVVGQEDGSFDSGDYVLFYAQDAYRWAYNSANKIFMRENNFYADTAYYFLTVSETEGLRVQPRATETLGTSHINSFDDYQIYEQDKYNPYNTGRVWYGENFDLTTQRDFSFSASGIDGTRSAKVRVATMAHSLNVPTSFTVNINGSNQSSLLNLSGFANSDYPVYGVDATGIYTLNLPDGSDNVAVKLSYNKNGNSSAIGYLNYIEVNMPRKLALYGEQTAFRRASTLGSNGVLTYALKAASGSVIWDITSPQTAVGQEYAANGDSLLFAVNNEGLLREFVVFNKNASIPAPTWVGRIANQNLHSYTTPDLVIITPPVFLSEAQRLAAFRNSNDGLDVQVATTTAIYNEFSSGAQDLVALRDFVRMLYLNDSDKLKYVLLFGDCSFDYKGRTINKTNFVPTYQSNSSIAQLYNTFCSDDFIGLMDSTEGTWTDASNERMDLGVGRLPVRSQTEAKAMVDKFISYATNKKSLGTWRTRLAFVAEQDKAANINFLQQAEGVEQPIETSKPAYNLMKVYQTSYPTVATPSGQRSPATAAAINEAVERGSLIVSYLGHGGELQWANSYILTLDQINAWNNPDNMPFFITATCDFVAHDNPAITSGGESIVLHPNGGGIGIIGASRPVFSSSNESFNNAFYATILQKIEGKYQRLGDVMRTTKNNSMAGLYNKSYVLMSDPSARLAYPSEDIVITSINGKQLTTTTSDTISGLEKVTIEGEVQSLGTKMNNFNGTIYCTVYDQPTTMNGYDGISTPITYKVRRDIIFKGEAHVKNGAFSLEFIAPKDISYNFGDGKMSFYAKQDSSMTDATGAAAGLTIGGSAEAITDENPPVVELFMNDTTFVNGGITDANPLFLAKLTDDNGINVSTKGIGHEMTLVIDGDDNNLLIVNDYYQTVAGTYQKGYVRYPLSNLSDGTHTARFKAWDTHNNSAESVIHFVVTSSPNLVIDELFSYPNPFTDFTNFGFTHNKAGQDLTVSVEIFDVIGQKVKHLETTLVASDARVGLSSQLRWNGDTDNGSKLRSGMYVYRLKVSTSDGKSAHKTDKLVLVR